MRLFCKTQTGVLRSSFAGLLTGVLIGVIVTLLVLMIIAGAKGQENGHQFGPRSLNQPKIGAGGGNRTHGLGIMRPSLYH
jgi:hypothetical protein